VSLNHKHRSIPRIPLQTCAHLLLVRALSRVLVDAKETGKEGVGLLETPHYDRKGENGFGMEVGSAKQ
jgi:hypothetical protein